MGENKKPMLNDNLLKNVTTLALLVGRFDKMQVYDIHRCNDIFLSFELTDWNKKRDFRKSLELLANHYPIVKQYINNMNGIFEKQDKYRKENNLETLKEYLVKKGLGSKINDY